MKVRLNATLAILAVSGFGCADDSVSAQDDITTEQAELRNHTCSHGRVPMCHRHRHSPQDHHRTICVRHSRIAWHLSHGDTLGPCPDPEECPPEIECGDGTTLVDGECVPDNPLTCGPGTIAVNGQCVPDNPLTCGPGTIAVNGQCVPENPLTCGPGTIAVNGQCVPENPLTCGPDQTPQCGCAADADFDGVCDAADVCPGMDDGVDTDGDGHPDGCDVDTDVFEPNDVTPYPISFLPLAVTPQFADGNDIDQLSFHAFAGQVIVSRICADVAGQQTAPLYALRNDDGVIYTNVGLGPLDGCSPEVTVAVPTTGTYVFVTRERPTWGVSRLPYRVFLDVR